MKRSMTLAALMLCLAPLAHAQNVTYITVDAPGAAGETSITTLNKQGEFVGEYKDAAGKYHGFLGRRTRTGFQFTPIEYPGAAQTALTGLNDFGVISGEYFDTAGVQHGFVRFPGFSRPIYVPVDVPGAVPSFDVDWEFGTGLSTNVGALNDCLDLVGQFADAHEIGHGFVFRGGRLTQIDHPQAAPIPGFFGGTGIIRINNEGDFVGEYGAVPVLPGIPNIHGFLNHRGQFIAIDPPGSIFTQVFAINNRRDIGGFSYDANFIGHGFIYRNGQYTQIDVPGAVYLSTVGCITDSGDFSGEYVDGFGVTHGYIAIRR